MKIPFFTQGITSIQITMLDVAIVGGGPAGLITAGTLKKLNPDCDCTVFEEHSSIGEPSHCAGLINIEGLKRLGISTDADYVLNKIRGAVFHGIGGVSVQIVADNPKAVVIDRAQFDQSLANHAKSKGVNILLNHRIQKVQRENKSWVIKSENENFTSSYLVCADGVVTSITRQINLPLPRPLTPAIQCEVEDPSLKR
ncbi:MAG: NAD(P)/FAD-dependent oxidoreductase, partial [Candidatus Ranarchaeia archaeon]